MVPFRTENKNEGTYLNEILCFLGLGFEANESLRASIVAGEEDVCATRFGMGTNGRARLVGVTLEASMKRRSPDADCEIVSSSISFVGEVGGCDNSLPFLGWSTGNMALGFYS